MPYKDPEVKKQKDREYARKNAEKNKARAKEWYEENKQQALKSRKKWREANKKKMKGYAKRWAEENKDHKNELSKVWKKENKEKVLANTRKRQAAKLNATPAWADKVAIEYVYYAAKVIERVYGTKWHVDHIIPLKGKNVCGLHVENNLQLLAPLDNLKKSNSLGGY